MIKYGKIVKNGCDGESMSNAPHREPRMVEWGAGSRAEHGPGASRSNLEEAEAGAGAPVIAP